MSSNRTKLTFFVIVNHHCILQELDISIIHDIISDTFGFETMSGSDFACAMVTKEERMISLDGVTMPEFALPIGWLPNTKSQAAEPSRQSDRGSFDKPKIPR